MSERGPFGKLRLGVHDRRRGLQFLRLFFVVGLAVGCSAAVLASGPTAGADPSPTAGMNLAFSAGFSGSSLDTSTWDTCYPWSDSGGGCTNFGNPQEEEWYLPSQDQVSGGALHMVADQTPTAGTTKSGSPETYQYSSGMVTTYKSFSFTYGYVQISAQLPGGDGTWPALWLLPTTQLWPPEVDIMENWGDPNSFNATVHWGSESSSQQAAQHVATSANLDSGYHTYGLLWEPGSLTWYLDGQSVFTYTGAGVPSQPMYLLANLAIDGPTSSGASFNIQSVQIYEPGASGTTGSGSTTPTPAPTTTSSPAPSNPTAQAPSASTASLPVTRVAGSDSVGTSVAISQKEYPTAHSAHAVVLARSDYFTDALAGGPLAAHVGGPLLETPGASLSSSLDPRVATEISRVLAPGGTVYVLGGDAAISPAIDTQLQALGYQVQRIAGADEYATAIDVAEFMGNPSVVFEATGLNFGDALSAGPAAIQNGAAVLLTDGSTQNLETALYLMAHPGDTRYAIGGPLAAYGADTGAIPVYGQDVYQTAVAVASRFFPGATSFGAVADADFADAAAAGPMLGAMDTPLLVVPGSGPLPEWTTLYIAWTSTIRSGTVFGGPGVLGNDVQAELAGL